MSRDTDHRFPLTRWSLVAHSREPAESQKALSELCELYWKPLYSFIRRSGWTREDARDLTQEFLARILERRQLDQAAPEQGKLRSYLLAYLKNFLSDQRKFAYAQKRGGGVHDLSLDTEGAESLYTEISSTSPTPDALFEQTWILTLLETVLAQLEENYTQRNQRDLFLALKPTLQIGDSPDSHAEIAARLGMREGALKVAAHRLKNRYREELHQHLRDTLAEDENIEDELRYFAQILSTRV